MGPNDDDLSRIIDTTAPNVGRVYDYFLGGKDNFAADRELAARILELMPDAERACRSNREFLVRVVGHLAHKGVAQFIDIGSGLPTHPNVHNIVQSINPDARVLYVDNDYVVATHARALLMGGAGVLAIDGDLRKPEAIIDGARELIDFRQPVAVLMFAVLHFLTDAEKPAELVATFRDVIVPGSCLAISHITDDDINRDVSQKAQEVYSSASAPAVPRSQSEIGRFFAGFSIMGPGVVDINDWPTRNLRLGMPTLFYGGVGIKDGIPRQSPLPQRASMVPR